MQITIRADQPQAILIGHQGEYGVEEVFIDTSVWKTEYGTGVLSLSFTRPDGTKYPVLLTDDTWHISKADNEYDGRGSAQLNYQLSNGRKKSCSFDVYVAKSDSTTPAPDPYETWMDALQAIAALTQANAQRAETSAGAAETSEANAAESEANAKASETAAATSEANAAGSAISAAESAGSASSSATAAATSESNAAVSASAAAESEANAATSATQAAASAESAGSSATAAAGSATSAWNSATAASGSASAAAGSAASASESATAAAGSASSASGSATAASASSTAAYSSALDSEAWAVGQKAGVDVPATDARYHNNSKYYAQQAAESATSAAGSATSALGSATSAGTSATNAAASAQAAQDVLDSIPEDYSELSADVSGLKDDLENKENWLVGTANQLLSDSYTEDKVPYVFRNTGGDLSVGDREADTIVGGSIVWNQQAKELTSANWRFESHVVGKFQDGEAVFTSDTYNYGLVSKFAIKELPSHKVLVSFEGKAESECSVIERINSSSSDASFIMTPLTTSYKRVDNIHNLRGTSGILLILSGAGATNKQISIRKYNVFDLTAMFGSTIADYIYSLEQATAGAGVAWFKQYFSNDYYEYDTGTLKSIEGLFSHDTVGFNQWDEEWELGQFDANTGADKSASNTIRSKNFIEVFPDTQYYFCRGGSNGSLYAFYYDVDKNFINYVTATNIEIVTPQNCRYIKFYLTAAYGVIYNNNICINISDTAKNGTYEPYQKHSYPLDSSITLRGIPKLDANNKMYFDGDVYEPEGTVTRRYGVVDLGTLTWTYNTSNLGAFTSNGLSSTIASRNIICEKYPTKEGGTSSSEVIEGNKWISVNKGNNTTESLAIGCIIVRDSSYTDAATFKAAMSGVTMIYEVATPTTETAEPYEPLQICSEYGTEEYVYDSEAFPIPVGHDTKYYVNLRKKIEDMSDDAVQVSGTDPTITAQSGVRYVCGEVATLSITLPQSGITDVVFTCGTTATVLLITGSVQWANGFDPSSLEANATYELNVMDGLGVAIAWT